MSGTDGLPADSKVLREIERRVLWLSARLTYRDREHERRRTEGAQESYASAATILTALRFGHVADSDRITVVPELSPVTLAIDHLTGHLDATASVDRPYAASAPRRDGIVPGGAPVWHVAVGEPPAAALVAATVDHHLESRLGVSSDRRLVALVGAVDLEDGSTWDSLSRCWPASFGKVMVVVDLPRQRGARILPEQRAIQLKRLFSDAGWQVLEARHGHLLQAAFARPGGEALRHHVESIGNAAYQELTALAAGPRRERILDGCEPAVADLLEPYDEAALAALIFNLGGHDIDALLDCFRACDADPGRPGVVFAHTIRGWYLPASSDSAGAWPADHEIETLRAEAGLTTDTEWDRFDPHSAAGRLCASVAAHEASGAKPRPRVALPAAVGGVVRHALSSPAQALTRVMERLTSRGLDSRLVTCWDPAAIGSSSMASTGEHPPDRHRLLPELWGADLVEALVELDAAHATHDTLVLPIGVTGDDTSSVADALPAALRSGARFVLIEIPGPDPTGSARSNPGPVLGISRYEPAFTTEAEWILYHALDELTGRYGGSSWLRLSSERIDQTRFGSAVDRLGEARLRRHVLAGGYRMVEPSSSVGPGVTVLATGPVVALAVDAADELEREGVPTAVLNLTSPDLVLEDWMAVQSAAVAAGRRPDAISHIERLVPAGERHRPVLTLHDGTCALGWIGGALGISQIHLRSRTLDVDRATGARRVVTSDLTPDHIVNAALVALDRSR